MEETISSVNYPVCVFIVTPSVMAWQIVRTALMNKIAMKRVSCNLIFLKLKCLYVRNALFNISKIDKHVKGNLSLVDGSYYVYK